MQQQPKIRRPKSDGRCIHCRELLTETTKDHVFPSSWYPDTTPDDVQRWTAPSCRSCNENFGELEKELLVFLACCINPTKPAAQGLYERVRRTMGIGVEGLSAEEKQHREARRRKLLNEAQPYSPEVQPHIIPGLGPHPEAPVSSQRQLTIKADDIHAVVKKIVRGCEYWLAGGRIVEPPYETEVFFPTETPELVAQLLTAFALGPVHLLGVKPFGMAVAVTSLLWVLAIERVFFRSGHRCWPQVPNANCGRMTLALYRRRVFTKA